MTNAQRIPAFVNPESGTAKAARDALERTGLFDIHEVPPEELEKKIRETVAGKPARILIAGGDGTIRTAAEVVAGTGVELAVLPSGTLNHFARDHGLPTDLDEAAQVAAGPFVASVDAGRVGDSLFHGTSSIGAYVIFMRVRDRLEPRLGYRLSSFLAVIWTFMRMPAAAVELEIDGKAQTYRTPLVFIGVGERELQLPTLGGRVEGGKRGLHVLVVRGRRRTRLLLLALDSAARGLKRASRTPELDAFMVERCTITMKRKSTRVAFDGEARYMETPLEYRLQRDILRVVMRETPKEDRGPASSAQV